MSGFIIFMTGIFLIALIALYFRNTTVEEHADRTFGSKFMTKEQKVFRFIDNALPYFAVLFMVSFLVATQAHADTTPHVLPKDWTGHIKGIEVNEADLGTYRFTEDFDGVPFHFFETTFQSKTGTVTCEYPVNANELYIGIVTCTLRR
jgi:hypothetical protein